jgi:hypothetical protein
MRTAAPRMRSSANSVRWSGWVIWPARRSRVEVSCHQVRDLGHHLLASYAALCIAMRGEVGGDECAHRRPAAAAPSCSAPSTATIRGSYGSSCDAASTPCGQQGGWTGTGETGLVRRRDTPSGSSNVVGYEDLAHEHCGSDG